MDGIDSSNIISHRHVHPDSTLAALAELGEALHECADAIRDALPHWIACTETAPFTEDAYDYLLERVLDEASLSDIPRWYRYPPQKEKECMFEKEK